MVIYDEFSCKVEVEKQTTASKDKEVRKESSKQIVHIYRCNITGKKQDIESVMGALNADVTEENLEQVDVCTTHKTDLLVIIFISSELYLYYLTSLEA